MLRQHGKAVDVMKTEQQRHETWPIPTITHARTRPTSFSCVRAAHQRESSCSPSTPIQTPATRDNAIYFHWQLQLRQRICQERTNAEAAVASARIAPTREPGLQSRSGMTLRRAAIGPSSQLKRRPALQARGSGGARPPSGGMGEASIRRTAQAGCGYVCTRARAKHHQLQREITRTHDAHMPARRYTSTTINSNRVAGRALAGVHQTAVSCRAATSPHRRPPTASRRYAGSPALINTSKG